MAGRVLDSAGNALSHAVVMLDSRTAMQTDSAGRFHFDNVPPGVHAIQVRTIGFARAAYDFTLDKGTRTTIGFRLAWLHVPLQTVCIPELPTNYIAPPSVLVRAPNVPGLRVTVTQADSVERFTLASAHDVPDSNGMRTFGAFPGSVGRFDVAVNAPGYDEWRATVTVERSECHAPSQTVTARLVRQR